MSRFSHYLPIEVTMRMAKVPWMQQVHYPRRVKPYPLNAHGDSIVGGLPAWSFRSGSQSTDISTVPQPAQLEKIKILIMILPTQSLQ